MERNTYLSDVKVVKSSNCKKFLSQLSIRSSNTFIDHYRCLIEERKEKEMSRTKLIITYVLLVIAMVIKHIFRVKFVFHSALMYHNYNIYTIRTKFCNDFRYFLRLKRKNLALR